MQASLGINYVLAASNFGPADLWTDLYNHASHPTSALILGVSGGSPTTSTIPKYVIMAFNDVH